MEERDILALFLLHSIILL